MYVRLGIYLNIGLRTPAFIRDLAFIRDPAFIRSFIVLEENKLLIIEDTPQVLRCDSSVVFYKGTVNTRNR